MLVVQVKLLAEISNILPIPVNISLSTAILFLLPLVTSERARSASEPRTRDSARSARSSEGVISSRRIFMNRKCITCAWEFSYKGKKRPETTQKL